ncbi:hypothetical protein KIM372_02020 [Bombiscardovia nodaiensis]|uniref:Uncharacterized protein n=1 Tax=Bombiscardovia nodaiensis TaxID=2932181 RepID=A0ABM8B606_9BIFI|nr:hypothetical protein KIM372_02020 [Bombiscardovia nodaiensis]
MFGSASGLIYAQDMTESKQSSLYEQPTLEQQAGLTTAVLERPRVRRSSPVSSRPAGRDRAPSQQTGPPSLAHFNQSALLDYPPPASAATVSSHRPESPAHRRDSAPAYDPLPDLIQLSMLPGPGSMRLLIEHRLVQPLDATCSYLTERATGIFGRASVVAPLLPYGAAACNNLADWVWTGGSFPESLDIVSNSHYRSLVYSHSLRVHNRRLPSEHLMKLGQLWTTSPMRTACDLACEETSEDSSGKLASIHTLMESYQVSCRSCLDLLEANPRWPGHSTGIETFNILKQIL